MNFSSFTSQLANISGNSLNQLTNTKLPSNIPYQNGQLVVSGTDGNLHYLTTSIESNNQFSENQTPSSSLTTVETSDSTNITDSPIITLPITVPGLRPGDAQQTVHIQVMNPNALQTQASKFQMGQMSIPSLQSFEPNGTTVLTVAYNPSDGKLISNGFPEGMTVVAALQPQDLQMLAQSQQQHQTQEQHQFIHRHNQLSSGLQELDSPIMQNIVNDPLEDNKSENTM